MCAVKKSDAKLDTTLVFFQKLKLFENKLDTWTGI